MKKASIITMVLLLSYNIQSQQLNINETLSYIQKLYNKANDYNRLAYNKNKYHNFKYSFNKEGYFTEITFINGKFDSSKRVYINDLKSEPIIKNFPEHTAIFLYCKLKNCISFKREYEGEMYKNFHNNIGFAVSQEYEAKKLHKAIKYFLSLAKSKNYNRDIDDPFANIEYIIIDKKNIPLFDEKGTYSLNVNIGGYTKKFILDTGASETTISNVLERELILKKVIKKSDYLPDGLYKIADGSIISQRRVKIPQIKVNGLVIKNLIVSVGNSKSPLLLGRNFLDKFNNWSIDNKNKILSINNK